MVGKCINHVVPVLPLARRRGVSLVCEYPICTAGKRFRHEAEFDEGAHAVVEHEIVDLVNIKEIEVSCSASGDPHFIIKKTVAAYGPDSSLPLYSQQVLTPLISKTNDGPV